MRKRSNWQSIPCAPPAAASLSDPAALSSMATGPISIRYRRRNSFDRTSLKKRTLTCGVLFYCAARSLQLFLFIQVREFRFVATDVQLGDLVLHRGLRIGDRLVVDAGTDFPDAKI